MWIQCGYNFYLIWGGGGGSPPRGGGGPNFYGPPHFWRDSKDQKKLPKLFLGKKISKGFWDLFLKKGVSLIGKPQFFSSQKYIWGWGLHFFGTFFNVGSGFLLLERGASHFWSPGAGVGGEGNTQRCQQNLFASPQNRARIRRAARLNYKVFSFYRKGGALKPKGENIVTKNGIQTL